MTTQADGEAGALHPHHHSWKKIIIRTVLLLVIVGLLALLYFYVLEPYMDDIRKFVASLGPWAPVAYIVLFFLMTSLFLPESIIAIAAGTIFGLWMGWLWVVIAGFISAIIVFAFVRCFLSDRINKVIERHPKAYAVEQATGKAGFKILFLLRLAPVNYSMLNYLAAVGPCSFRSFLLACLGMIPGNFSTVYMGAVAVHTSNLASRIKTDHDEGTTGSISSDLPPNDSLVHEFTVYGGLVLAIIASVVVGRVAIKAIHRETERQMSLNGQEITS